MNLGIHSYIFLVKHVSHFFHVFFLRQKHKNLACFRMNNAATLTLMLSTLSKIFSRRHFDFFFLIFPRKWDLAFHANCQIQFSRKK